MKFNRKSTIQMTLVLIFTLLFSSVSAAAGLPYAFIEDRAYTLDEIIADINSFNDDVDNTNEDDILVDVSGDETGKYLNLGAYIEARIEGFTGTPEEYQQINPATPPATGDLEVVSVSAINGTEVTVTLGNVGDVLPEGSTFQVTDTNGSVYAVTSVVLVAGDEYKLTLGTAVSGMGTLTVKHGTSEANKDFDTTVEGITLGMSFSDDDAKLLADGADNTIVFVEILRNGEIDKTFDGTVKFMSLKGATFAKETVSFDKGVARVQLTSMSSAVDIMDTIIATIADADDLDAVGKSVQMNILYSPDKPVGPGVKEKVFITYAESDRASDLFVRFNDDIDFDALYAEHFSATATGKLYVQSPDGTDQPITDIIKVKNEERTVRLVLVEDTTTNDGWLTDNSTVIVGVTGAGQPNSVLLDGEVEFNLVDPKAPEALSVKAPDYRTIETRFTEPVREEPAQTAANWVLNGKQLEAIDLINDDSTDTPLVGREYKNTHTVYNRADSVDNRSYVTLNLSTEGVKKLKAAGKENILQAYNIEDYAGITDTTGNNKATTQEFRFITPPLPGAPTAKVELESPEQYRVIFNQRLANELDADNFEVSYQIGTRTNGTPIFIGDADEGTLLADAITAGTMPAGFGVPTMVDTFAGNANEVVVTPVPGTNNSEYLLEFAQDWTVTYDTENTAVNYYTPGRNHIAVTVIGDPSGGVAVESRSGIVMPGTYTEAKRMARDNKGPIIEIAEQNQDSDDNWLEEFTVRMNEPIQMNAQIPADGSKDTAILTPSQTQALGDDVPTPTFSFISEDESITIDAELKDPITVDDYEFILIPTGGATLTPGIWTISIRSISDDVGNTADTAEYTLEVFGKDPTLGQAKIVWADAHDNVEFTTGSNMGIFDVVHIQYGTEMSLDALQTNVYTINGKILPEGTRVFSEEYEYDSVNELEGTLVTIMLPKEFLGDTSETPGALKDPSNTDYDGDNQSPHILNVSKQLTDVNGTKILAPTEVQLPYNEPAIEHN